MIPKTEKELELYFKLMQLMEIKKQNDLPYTLKYPNTEMYQRNFDNAKKEYLKLAKK